MARVEPAAADAVARDDAVVGEPVHAGNSGDDEGAEGDEGADGAGVAGGQPVQTEWDYYRVSVFVEDAVTLKM